MRAGLLLAFLACGAFMPPPAAASDDAEALIVQEIEETLLRLNDLGVLGEVPRGGIEVGQSGRVRYELGAVINISTDPHGSPVVALTPGGTAERLGIQVGDRVLAINDVALAESGNPATDIALAINREDGLLRLKLLRDGHELLVDGEAEAIMVPGFRLRIERPVPPPKPRLRRW
jgi:C-terminal processing protease CtpA/Prc